MFRVLLFITVLISSKSIANESKSCENLTDDFSYYACLEAEYHCGEKGYPIGFGQKYSLRFENQIDSFSEQGRDWVFRTSTCLIKKLREVQDLGSCTTLKKKALKDHTSCYEQSGYCELEISDRKAVSKIIRLSMWRWGVIRSGMRLKKICKRKKRKEKNDLAVAVDDKKL